MNKLDPSKLTTDFLPYVNETEPIIFRRYTLTHSDTTAQLFLTVSSYFACNKITPMRDEVLAEWVKEDSELQLHVYIHVDGPLGTSMSPVRYGIFVRELPLALEAIRYGDRLLFEKYPLLNRAKIIVYFNSMVPKYNRIEYWGQPKDYK